MRSCGPIINERSSNKYRPPNCIEMWSRESMESACQMTEIRELQRQYTKFPGKEKARGCMRATICLIAHYHLAVGNFSTAVTLLPRDGDCVKSVVCHSKRSEESHVFQILRLPTKNVGILRMTYWGSFYTASMALPDASRSERSGHLMARIRTANNISEFIHNVKRILSLNANQILF
jgi:hypothetical protein